MSTSKPNEYGDLPFEDHGSPDEDEDAPGSDPLRDMLLSLLSPGALRDDGVQEMDPLTAAHAIAAVINDAMGGRIDGVLRTVRIRDHSAVPRISIDDEWSRGDRTSLGYIDVTGGAPGAPAVTYSDARCQQEFERFVEKALANVRIVLASTL